MLNIFYVNAAFWFAISILYSFCWSALCIPLSAPTIIFLIFMIGVSIGIGFLLRKHFRFYLLTEYKHSWYITLGLGCFFLIEFLYEWTVPLFAVLSGNSMYDKNLAGIPLLHMIASAALLIYCFYLFYLFLCFKKWTLLVEYGVCLSVFVLLFQRQNIVVIVAGTIWLAMAYLFSLKLPRKKRAWLITITIIVAVIACLIGLYIFGIMGNARYGIWGPFDSTMIKEVAKTDGYFPEWIPDEYVWAYSYLTSPLANLQHNLNAGIYDGATFGSFISCFLPSLLTQPFSPTKVPRLVLSEALVVSTAFAKICRCIGAFGMYLLFTVELAAVVGIIFLTKKHKHLYIPYVIGCGYFFLLSFFDNPIEYIISCLMLILPIGYVIFRRIALWGWNKWKAHKNVAREPVADITAPANSPAPSSPSTSLPSTEDPESSPPHESSSE